MCQILILRAGLLAMLWLLAGLLPAPALAAAAPEPVWLDAGTGQPSLAGRLSYLRDPSGQLTLEEVIARREAGAFTTSDGPRVAAGFLPRGAVWLHLRVARDTDAPSEWWLHAAGQLIDDIALHVETGTGVFEVRHGGRALPFAEREVAWGGHAFRLGLDDAAPRDIYLRYASWSTLRIDPGLFTPRAFEEYRSREYTILGAFFGVMSIALLISAFRAIYYRSLLDGLYALYILALETMNLALVGLFQQWGLFERLALQQILTMAGAVVAGLALAGFVRILIVWPPTWARRFDITLAAAGTAYVGSLLLIWQIVPATAIHYTNLVSGLLILAILLLALSAAFRGFPHARLFLVAFLPFLVTVVARIAQSFGLIDGAVNLHYLWLLGTLVHVVLLGTAVLIRDAGARHAKARLEARVEKMGQDIKNQKLFMRMLAHELRTPLAIIDSQAQLLGRDAASDSASDSASGSASGSAADSPSQKMARTAKIRSSVARMSTILDRLITSDRLGSFERVERMQINFKAIILGAVAEVQLQTDNHILRSRIEDERLGIVGDPALLRVMLMNLLENAVRYSPEGGVVELHARADRDGGVTIEVIDEGVGIPAELQEKIFERHYRIGHVKGADGVGLGLDIARTIAQLHHGNVVCESTPGEGSAFRVTLPLR